MKRLLCLLALGAALAGCSGSDTPEACRYDAVQALNGGNWDRAIDLLSNDANCAEAFSEEERRVNLAAAYIGKAGYDPLDVLDVLLEENGGAGSEGDRLISRFSSLASGRDAMTFMDQATAQYQALMTDFPGGLNEACDETNYDGLSRLQKNACFFNGLMATVRSSNAISNLLEEDLDAWLGNAPLDCANDRNLDGTVDKAQISACAMIALPDLADGSGACAGGLTWRTLGALGYDPLPFSDADGTQLAEFSPVEVTVPADAACAADGDKIGYRLAQGSDPDRSLAVTSGLCLNADVSQSCALADPAANCWVCPVFNAAGDAALSANDQLVDSLNEDGDQFIATLPADQQADAEQSLNDFRSEICNAVVDPANACTTAPDGTLVVNEGALADYLNR